MTALVLFSYLIPASPIPETTFYGNSFSWQKLFMFLTLLVVGFMFVAALNKRRNPLLSRNQSYKVRTSSFFFFCCCLLKKGQTRGSKHSVED